MQISSSSQANPYFGELTPEEIQEQAEFAASLDRRKYESRKTNVDERFGLRCRAINLCIMGLFERHKPTGLLLEKYQSISQATEWNILKKTMMRDIKFYRELNQRRYLREEDALVNLILSVIPWSDWSDKKYAEEGLRRIEHLHQDIRELSIPTIKGSENYRYHPEMASKYKPITDALIDQANKTKAFLKDVRREAQKGIALRVGLIAAGILTIGALAIQAIPFAIVTAVAFTALGIIAIKRSFNETDEDKKLSGKAELALFPKHDYEIHKGYENDLQFSLFLSMNYSSISVV